MKTLQLAEPKKGEKILLAFSGGLDSRVLLELLCREKEELQLELALFYMDHALRPGSADEARFALQVAQEKGIPGFSERVDVTQYCSEHGLGTEEGARILRYEKLREIKERLGFDTIALAHHLGDNVETFFLNLLRGSGMRGLSGMQVRSEDLYRPLLSYEKKELEEYARENGLAYVTDESNAQVHYTRNKLRLQVLPLLEDIAPGYTRSVERTMKLFQREEAFLEKLVEREEKSLERPWRVDVLLDMEEAALYRLLRREMEEKTGSLKDVSLHSIERVVETLRRGRGKTVIGGYQFTVSQGKLYLVQCAPEDSPRYQKLVMGSNTLLGMKLILEQKETPQYGDDVLSIPTEQVKGPLIVRTRRPGDRFVPSGLEGSKKLKDFLIDEKVPLPLRDKILLVCDEETIYWIIGYRKAQIPRETKGDYLVLRMIDALPKEEM